MERFSSGRNDHAMPRFFFHVFDEFAMRDEEGIELADAGAARAAALAGIRAMMCDDVKKGRLALHHRMEVEDEAGETVVDLDFRDAVFLEM
jgi:hypothetical protein